MLLGVCDLSLGGSTEPPKPPLDLSQLSNALLIAGLANQYFAATCGRRHVQKGVLIAGVPPSSPQPPSPLPLPFLFYAYHAGYVIHDHFWNKKQSTPLAAPQYISDMC